VYGFALQRREDWANRINTYFVGKFKAKNDPKDGFYTVDCRNRRECRMIEFLLPILHPKKPKRLSITMANTIFRALSGSRPVIWGRLIQELVEKSIPHIGKKPSPLSSYLLQLYQHHKCVIKEEEDAMTIAKDKVAYILMLDVEPTEARTEEFVE
jgi:hypothetical protein